MTGGTTEETVSFTDLTIITFGTFLYAGIVLIHSVEGISSLPTILNVLSLSQMILGSILALFAPGYALVALLSPRLQSVAEFGRGEQSVVSFLLSVTILIVQGILFALSPRGFQLDTITLSTVVIVLSLVFVAGISRIAQTGKRGVIDLRRLRQFAERLWSPPTRIDTVLNVALIVLVLVSVGAFVHPAVGDNTAQFTEFGVLVEDESGDLVATNVSSTLSSEDSGPLAVSLTNRELEAITYTLVVQVQRAYVGERSVEVLESRQIDRRQVTLANNETQTIRYQFNTNSEPSDCRVAFLLYKGEVPDFPTVDNAYRELHVWDGNAPSTRTACSSLDAIDISNR
ncbi:DUF1616 domain-containing protein [Halorubrum sp. T3]|uniref:DUF1616 domain-containing protein n=1 Tax=Halorubrum sp. T3 TaxID=1194088 RepID=UPI00178C6AFE|nr:DUF1616 domain-containing protein [Halorubrum sp. T3]